jgi:hypothetical protein
MLQVEVRKFFCDHPTCQRRIFGERLREIAAPWARRTNRLNVQLSEIGLALGGTAGTKLSQKLHCGVSRNTILRLVMRLPPPQVSAPKIVGVDDFAFCKCVSYGTIIVDLETHKPIALLPGRSADPIAQWLSQHPGIETVSRDRSSSFRSGITAGAFGRYNAIFVNLDLLTLNDLQPVDENHCPTREHWLDRLLFDSGEHRNERSLP